MAGRRDIIRMSDEEMLDFLRSSKTITICSNGPKGHPHAMPMWFAVDDDRTVRMTTFRKSQKVVNVRRDPRVTLLAEAGAEYEELRGVLIYGRCEILDDIEPVKETLVDISSGEVGGDPKARAGMYKVIEGTAAKRVCLVIRPDEFVSWDHRKLAGVY
jgi:nitroimidazol reductase NimA-like FMN-containing flavoprotein (pyridoxamine 5'-phosphate oxidase superfamily)